IEGTPPGIEERGGAQQDRLGELLEVEGGGDGQADVVEGLQLDSPVVDLEVLILELPPQAAALGGGGEEERQRMAAGGGDGRLERQEAARQGQRPRRRLGGVELLGEVCLPRRQLEL